VGVPAAAGCAGLAVRGRWHSFWWPAALLPSVRAGFSCSRALGFLCGKDPCVGDAILSGNGEAHWLVPAVLQFLSLFFRLLILEGLCSALLGHLSLWTDLNFSVPLFSQVRLLVSTLAQG